MTFLRAARSVFVITSLGVMLNSAQAGDLTWAGYYRAEGVLINGAESRGNRVEKSYLLHHMVLRPSIVVTDGWTIRSRFDVMNNRYYPNSGLGQFIGSGPRSSAINTTATNATDQYNSLSQNQGSDTIAINELYLTYQHEFGTLVVGRAPLDFGLGMTYNTGRDNFAHWLSNRDMVGYKITFGNFSLMPMYGKMDEGNLDHEDDINDYMMRFEYDNADTGTAMGVFFSQRIGPRAGNDTPVVNGIVGGNNSVNDQRASLTQKSANIFFRRDWTTFSGALEVGFVDGRTGVYTDRNLEVARNGFGVATEFELRPEESRYTYSLKMGLATGDNGNTADRFDGFTFHRNYDVGELMFNHVLGQGDFLSTQYTRPRAIGPDGKQNASAFADVEAVSNVFYISPAVDRKLNDAWILNGRFVYALLNQGSWRDIERNQTELLTREYGFELDLGITYKPYENLTWKTTAAFFWPGNAFTGGSANYERIFVDGAVTKLSVGF